MNSLWVRFKALRAFGLGSSHSLEYALILSLCFCSVWGCGESDLLNEQHLDCSFQKPPNPKDNNFPPDCIKFNSEPITVNQSSQRRVEAMVKLNAWEKGLFVHHSQPFNYVLGDHTGPKYVAWMEIYQETPDLGIGWTLMLSIGTDVPELPWHEANIEPPWDFDGDGDFDHDDEQVLSYNIYRHIRHREPLIAKDLIVIDSRSGYPTDHQYNDLVVVLDPENASRAGDELMRKVAMLECKRANEWSECREFDDAD